MAFLIGTASTSAYTVANTYNNNATYAMFNGNATEGVVAVAGGTAAKLNLYINSWTSGSIKACLYDSSNNLLNSVIIPSSVGTGFVSVVFPNTTITSGQKYRLAIYLVASGGVSLFTKTGALTKREVSSGSYTSPVATLPAGTFVSTNEFYWALETAPAYSITDIDGDNVIEVGQTFTINTVGFTGQPVATNSQSGNGVTVTITGGSANVWTATVSERVEGAAFSALPITPVTLTLTNGSESASRSFTLTKKTIEANLIFSGVVTTDPKMMGYHLAADGFTVEGSELTYEQPAPTATMPVPNLVLTSDGGGSVKEACTFTSWFRPATGAGAGAGNVYAYTWNISEAGVTPVDLNPDSDTFGTVSGRPISTPTPAAKTITLVGMTTGVDVLAVPSGGLRYRVSTDGGATFGAFTTASTNVRNGYVLDAEITSSSSVSTTVTGTLTVGTVAFTLVVTTAAADNIPDTLVFSSTTNAEVLSQYTSETKTVTGMDSGQSSAFTVANGTYSKNGGAFISTAGTMQNGDTFALRGTSDTYFGRSKDITLTAANGNVVSTYRITNKYDPLISGNGGSDIKVSARKITGRKI